MRMKDFPLVWLDTETDPHYILAQDFTLGEVTVPKYFRTDFITIPRLFRLFFSPIGTAAPAAMVHDYIYEQRRDDFTRKEADDLFKINMDRLGVTSYKAWTFYLVARLYGWVSWYSKEFAEEKGS